MQLKIPKNFEEKFRSILGDEYEKLVQSFKEYAKDCIRVNTLKITREELKNRLKDKEWKIEEVPWYRDAFFVETEESLAKTPEYFLGYYYIEDAASLVPPLVLDPKPGEKVLDLCAAPGSKTTMISELMKDRGIIVANDKDPSRIKALATNVQKIGATNVAITQKDGRHFWKYGLTFDKILLDVPCSGTGTIITNWNIMKFWSPKAVRRLSNLQKQLISSAVRMLNPGGILVYSTCSLDPEENEENIDWAIEKFELKILKINIPGLNYRSGIEEWDGKNYSSDVKNCIRFYPFDNQTEGFFVCKLKKLM